ncbi:Uncharacterized protein RDABS01_039269 [Bienertia sinuspersici]
MDGYGKMIWKNYGIDKVVGIQKGKPILIKPWSPDHDVSMEDLMIIPIWIHVHAHYKYWGSKSLEKLTRTVGMFVKVDHTTTCRDRLAYARCRK